MNSSAFDVSWNSTFDVNLTKPQNLKGGHLEKPELQKKCTKNYWNMSLQG